MNILGVRFGHDAAAALIIDGRIIASIAEERLTRIKHDTSFPVKAIKECLRIGNIKSEEIDCLALPNLLIPDIFFRFFQIPNCPQEYREPKPRNLFRRTIPVHPGLPVMPLYYEPFQLSETCRIHLSGHHRAHAASAYYTSGLDREGSLVVTMDGSGDDISCAFWSGKGRTLTLKKAFGRESSLGYFYSNCTEALGWRHGGNEWKLMGLAPYGRTQPGLFEGYHPVFENGELVEGREYGDFGRWNDHGANHYHGRDSLKLQPFVDQVGAENFAAEAQRVVEEQGMNLLMPWIRRDGSRNLCCAGGFFLNVKFNQKLWYTGELSNQWVYPDCGDSGLSVGAALDAYAQIADEPLFTRLSDVYFGPDFSDSFIKQTLDERGITYFRTDSPEVIAARHLAENHVIGWFQGKMEAGPRALGHRSILMSPLRKENKDLINAKVKYREMFRPFCPSMLHEMRDDYLVGARDEEYMITSFEVLKEKKGRIPAVVHEDETARPQMVKKDTEPLYHSLISEFRKITGKVLSSTLRLMSEANRLSVNRVRPFAAFTIPVSMCWCSAIMSLSNRLLPCGTNSIHICSLFWSWRTKSTRYVCYEKPVGREVQIIDSPLRMVPDFIIPGETKCGTTTFFRCIEKHPDIASPDMKEPNNFIRYGGTSIFCRMHFPFYFRKLLSPGMITGEASVEYLSKDHTPFSIYSLVPDVKLIIMLRNPIRRALSDYLMMKDSGREPETFDQVVEKTVSWLTDESLERLVAVARKADDTPLRYLTKGCYSRTIRPWLEMFPRENIRIIKSETFLRNHRMYWMRFSSSWV